MIHLQWRLVKTAATKWESKQGATLPDIITTTTITTIINQSDYLFNGQNKARSFSLASSNQVPKRPFLLLLFFYSPLQALKLVNILL